MAAAHTVYALMRRFTAFETVELVNHIIRRKPCRSGRRQHREDVESLRSHDVLEQTQVIGEYKAEMVKHHCMGRQPDKTRRDKYLDSMNAVLKLERFVTEVHQDVLDDDYRLK